MFDLKRLGEKTEGMSTTAYLLLLLTSFNTDYPPMAYTFHRFPVRPSHADRSPTQNYQKSDRLALGETLFRLCNTPHSAH